MMSIPASCINSAAAKFLASPYVPLPNRPGTRNNLVAVLANPANTDQGALRSDYTITPAMRIWGRYSYAREDRFNANPLPGAGTKENITTSTAGVHYSWTLSPRMVNEFRVDLIQLRLSRLGELANQHNVAAEIGIPGTSTLPIDFGTPNFASDDGFINLGEDQSGHPLQNRTNTYDFADDLSWKHRTPFLQDRRQLPTRAIELAHPQHRARRLHARQSSGRFGFIESRRFHLHGHWFLLRRAQRR
jgi:hypothetical protein